MMSGSMAPSAAALTGLAGTRSASHCPIEESPRELSAAARSAPAALARSDSSAAGSMGSSANSGPTIPSMVAKPMVTTMNASARPPCDRWCACQERR